MTLLEKVKREPYLQWPEILEPLVYLALAIALCL